jgi:hypothetical protein
MPTMLAPLPTGIFDSSESRSRMQAFCERPPNRIHAPDTIEAYAHNLVDEEKEFLKNA